MLRFVRGNLASRGDHVQCCERPDQSGQALRAASAGHDPKLDFRQGKGGAGRRDAGVSRKCYFKSAAQSGAVDCGHHGFVGVFDDRDDIRQCRFNRRFAEFANVRPADEDLACTAQHGRPDRSCCGSMVNGCGKPFAHLGRGGIDRRVVDRDDKNAIDNHACHNGGEFASIGHGGLSPVLRQKPVFRSWPDLRPARPPAPPPWRGSACRSHRDRRDRCLSDWRYIPPCR